MKFREFCVILIVATFATPSGIQAFERTGIPWCVEMLDHYEECLDSVTYERYEYIVRRDRRSAVYGGLTRNYRTYPTPRRRVSPRLTI